MAGLYGILGLDRDASSEDVKKAYQKLARKWHPDKNVGYESDAVIRFSEVSGAYDVLYDQSRREQYDAFCVSGIHRVSTYDFPNPHNGFSLQLNYAEGRLNDMCRLNDLCRSEHCCVINNGRVDEPASFLYPQFSSNGFSIADPALLEPDSLQKMEPELLYDCVESRLPPVKRPEKVNAKRKSSPEDVIVAKKPKIDSGILSEMEM